jgi:hypothetical protein
MEKPRRRREPYELTVEALADPAFLAGSGYDVAVCAWRARHYPGHVVAVEITTSLHLANVSAGCSSGGR